MEGVKFDSIKKISQFKMRYNDIKDLSKIDGTSPPSVFIGSKLKYPQVNVGILSPPERDDNSWVYDSPKYWSGNNFSIGEVIGFRQNLINSRFKSNVKSLSSQETLLRLAQEVAIASKPVDVEIELKNKLNLDSKKDKVLAFSGMVGNVKNAKITSNVKVHKKLDKVMNDDIKASEGINYLYKNSFDEYVLSKVLSVGVLGIKKDKKLVPTRWSITATDDLIAKNLIEEIKDCKTIENYEFFFGEFLGNRYLIMLMPNVWSFELFEIYLPKTLWNSSEEIKASTDFENFYGRKSYASNCAGGYYATRLPILEYLNKIRRQASVLVIRLETKSYWAGLGVWVVRESVKKAFGNAKTEFMTLDNMVESVKQVADIKYHFDVSEIFNKSILINNAKTQRNLADWF